MNKKQIITILVNCDEDLSNCPESMLTAFYEELKDKQYGEADVLNAFRWFQRGWDRAAQRLRM